MTAYATCTRGTRDPSRKARFDAAVSAVEQADAEFRRAGSVGEFRELEAYDFTLPEVSAAEMKSLYEDRFAKNPSPGRPIYDQIKVAAREGKCPLCGHRDVMTLDHYLPKASYPALAVNPANLVPACTDCNKTKLAAVADTLHPYFDNIEKDQWLRARVAEGTPLVSFFVRAPGFWPDRLAGRVEAHFGLFGLGRLYSAQAAHTMSGLQLQFSGLFDKVGAVGLREHIRDLARTWRAKNVNSWETALFDALAASQWYCSGGFRI